MESRSKKQLITFLIIAYGVTYLMGILMYVGMNKGVDLSQFVLAQMLYPAAGVIIGKMAFDKETKYPKAAFIVYLILTGIAMLLAILAVVAPMDPINLVGASYEPYYFVCQYIMMPFCAAFYIISWACGRERRRNMGLLHNNVKTSVWIVALFIVLYFVRLCLAFCVEQITEGTGVASFKEWTTIFTQSATWMSVVSLAFSFPFIFLCFLGEEYGWRYYLQPILQKKFGLRGGVLILGVIWALWHIPEDFCYYSTTTGVQMLLNQVITCTAYAIFFGWAYMKTQNMWVPIILHYLNNNLIPVVSGNYSADVLQNNELAWSDLPISLLIMVFYFLFIFTKEYHAKKNA